MQAALEQVGNALSSGDPAFAQRHLQRAPSGMPNGSLRNLSA
ncbi:hypothetical protein [Endothiovibrio diazotrophicus]